MPDFLGICCVEAKHTTNSMNPNERQTHDAMHTRLPGRHTANGGEAGRLLLLMIKDPVGPVMERRRRHRLRVGG